MICLMAEMTTAEMVYILLQGRWFLAALSATPAGLLLVVGLAMMLFGWLTDKRAERD